MFMKQAASLRQVYKFALRSSSGGTYVEMLPDDIFIATLSGNCICGRTVSWAILERRAVTMQSSVMSSYLS